MSNFLKILASRGELAHRNRTMNTFSKEFKEAWKKVDEVTKQQLLVDKEVHAFLKPIFDDEAERTRFIK